MLVFHTWHLNWSSIPHSEGIALSQGTLPLVTAVPLGEMVPLESTVPLLYIKVQLEGTFAGAVSSPQMLKSTSESVDQKSVKLHEGRNSLIVNFYPWGTVGVQAVLEELQISNMDFYA